MMLNILQCTREPPTAENYLSQNVISVRLRNPTLVEMKKLASGNIVKVKWSVHRDLL